MADEIETTDNLDIPDNLNPKKLDLAAMLAGQTYPKDVILVPLDREQSRLYVEQKNRARVASFGDDEDEIARETAKLKEIEHRVEETSLLITVQGLSREASTALSKDIQQVINEFKEEDGFDADNPSATLDLDNKVLNMTWAASIVKIATPDGSETEVTRDAIAMLVDQLPQSAVKSIQKSIEMLDAEAQNGYELIVKNSDFLSAL